MTMSERKIIELESGWEFMQKGITKLKNTLEGIPKQQFNGEEYIMLYTTIYNMCTQKPPQDYSQQLYDRYRESFEEYIASMVWIQGTYKCCMSIAKKFSNKNLHYKICKQGYCPNNHCPFTVCVQPLSC